MIHLPDKFEGTLADQAKSVGAESKEDYLSELVQRGLARAGLDAILEERLKGPFVPLPDDWIEKVKERAFSELNE